MTPFDREKYYTYIHGMTDAALDKETETAVRQSSANADERYHDSCAMVAMLHVEWRNRGKEKRFLDNYNKSLEDYELDHQMR